MFTFLHRLFGSRPVEKDLIPETDIRIERDKSSAASPVESAAVRTIRSYQGVFEPLFRQGPDYLTLLGLGPEALPALQFIADVVRENPEYRQSVLALLGDPGWRLHLVAAIAVLLSPDRIDLSPALWEAIDRGSWVAPQLGVVVSICDPQFVPRAKQRIVTGCPVEPVDIPSELVRHVIAGPGAGSPRSAKSLAALLHLVHTIPHESDWADTTSRVPDLHQLLRTDRDQSDKVAAHWAAALRDRLNDLGLPLHVAV
jgi:hypothetical protein